MELREGDEKMNNQQNEDNRKDKNKIIEGQSLQQPDEINAEAEKNKKNSPKNMISGIKASFRSKKFKGGAYATAVSAIVIVMVLVVNIIVTELGFKIDVSGEGMYTLTDVTKDYVSKIKDDVTIYYMAQTGGEDSTYTEIIDKYPSLSSHIKLEYKDPVLYPNFAKQYVEDEITENSVIVVNESNGRAKFVSSSDMLVSEIDYNSYQSYVTGIDVEGQITSAIQYVTTEDLPIMYTVEGHGETPISNTLASSLAKINVTTKSLATLTAETIPEDCSILLINAPQSDFSTEETSMIKSYLEAGGDAMIFANYGDYGLTNFNSLLAYYGIGLVEGVVLEGSQGYYMGQYINNLVPSMETHDITSSLKNAQNAVVVPLASGIQILNTARSTITAEPLLVTSDAAYSKVDVQSDTVEKEEADIDGPFQLGVVVTETYGEAETKLVVYGSPLLIDESMVTYSSIGNLDLFLNSVNYLSDQEETLAVRTRSLTQEYLTINAAQVNFWAVLVVIVLPALVLGFGGFICIRRRKK